MKNIKQTIKNKAKATGKFISDNKEIIIPLAVATVTLSYAVLKVKGIKKLSKEQEEQLKQKEYYKDVNDYNIKSTLNNEENGWANWAGVISGSKNQDSEEILKEMINDINNGTFEIKDITLLKK